MYDILYPPEACAAAGAQARPNPQAEGGQALGTVLPGQPVRAILIKFEYKCFAKRPQCRPLSCWQFWAGWVQRFCATPRLSTQSYPKRILLKFKAKLSKNTQMAVSKGTAAG